MRLLCYIIALCCLANSGLRGQVTFDSLYIHGEANSPSGIVAANDGYFVCGTGFGSEYNGNRVLKLIKLDLNGNLVWRSFAGADTLTYAIGNSGSLIQLGNGNLIQVGTSSNANNQVDALVVCFSKDGDILWTRTFGGVGFDDFRSVISVGDTMLLALGSSALSAASGTEDFYLVALDTAGNYITSKRYNVGNQSYGLKVSPYSDGGFLLSGQVNYSSTNSDAYFIKIDNQLNEVWHLNLGTSGNDCGASAEVLPNGDFVTSGCLDTLSNILTDVITYYEDDGSLRWRDLFASTNDVIRITWQVKFIDGYVYASGRKTEPLSGYDLGFFSKYDTSGQQIWEKFYANTDPTTGDTLFNTLEDFTQTADGGFILTGKGNIWDPNNSNINQQHYWVLKLDSNGCLYPNGGCTLPPDTCQPPCDTVGIETFVRDHNVVQVYPNPAHSYVSIELNNYYQGTTLQLYNLLGEKVLEQPLNNTTNRISLNLPEGVYVYKVMAKGKLLRSDKLVVW